MSSPSQTSNSASPRSAAASMMSRRTAFYEGRPFAQPVAIFGVRVRLPKAHAFSAARPG